MSNWYLFDDVDRFAPGAIGAPGQRTFFLQVQADGRVVTVKCEKLHVAALAKAFRDLLTDLPSDGRRVAPTVQPTDPVDPRWSLGSIGLGYEPNQDRIVVMLHEAPDVGVASDEDSSDTDSTDAGRIRLHITRDQAAAFADRGNELVAAGRPTCVLCSSPVDPEGVTCGCWN